jgi:hypothetical protein
MSAEAKQAVSQVATEIATHPKTAWLLVFIVNLSEWYVEWMSPVIIAATSILSFGTMVLLFRYHWLNTVKLKMDIDKEKAENRKGN